MYVFMQQLLSPGRAVCAWLLEVAQHLPVLLLLLLETTDHYFASCTPFCHYGFSVSVRHSKSSPVLWTCMSGGFSNHKSNYSFRE